MRQLLVEGNQFVLLPEVIWKVFTLWYGTAGYSNGPALPRLVRNYITDFRKFQQNSVNFSKFQ